jgi:hypothetical protein
MVGLALKYWRLSLNGEARWISWHVKQQEAELGGPGPVNATLTYRQREYRLGLSWLIIEW